MSRLVWIAVGAFLLGVLAVLALLLIRGNGSDEKPAPPLAPSAEAPAAAPAAPPAATIRSRSEGEQLAAAFAAAFGGLPPVRRSVGDSEIVYRPARLRWIGDRAVLVSAGTNRADCHACAGYLAVHYLVPEGAGFHVAGAWLEGAGSGSWGRPPDWDFSTLLAEQPMIRTGGGDGGQGYFCSWAQFYELSPSGPREVANVQTGYSDTGARVPEEGTPPTEVEGAIRNVVRGRSFDIVYTVRDFALRSDAFVPAGSRRVTDHYVLRGGRYVPSSGESRVPTC